MVRTVKRISEVEAKDADLWILIREELHRVHQEGVLSGVKHVKAHRSKKRNVGNVACRKVHR